MWLFDAGRKAARLCDSVVESIHISPPCPRKTGVGLLCASDESTGGHMASQPLFPNSKKPQQHASPYCSDPNCQSCKELREMQEAIRLHRPISQKQDRA